MKKQHFLAPLSLVLLMSMSLPSWGDESDLSSESTPYSFGGSCASQGSWTQNALVATQNLRKITLKLKNDRNCTNLGANLQSTLANLESSISNTTGSDKRVTRLSQIPAELSALRNFAANSPSEKNNILKLMMDRSVEGATLSAAVSQGNIDTSSKLMDFGSRISRGAKTGVQILNQMVDQLPQLNECLMGDGAMALGSFLSSTVKVAASFASSGQDSIGSQLATTISKITEYSRNKKFSKVLRKLNQQEFMTSMSCLLELTSESYCEAREAMGLFESAMKSLKFKKVNHKPNIATNPFTGHYILNTHVPNITKWMQKIQVGVEPKLPTDANFQNKIQQDITDFYKSTKDLLADYNMKLSTMKSMKKIDQQQNALIALLISVSQKMTDGTGHGDRDAQTNFFTLSKNAVEIPFFLEGVSVIPDQILGNNGMMIMSYDVYFQNNRSKVMGIDTPLAAAETIGRNMRILISEANSAAIQYYNRWYIVDKSALVNESITDVNYSVKDSLKAIQEYLDLAKQRIIKYKESASSIPIIIDTQVRIKNILKAYDDIEALGQKWKTVKGLNISEKDVLANADLYEKLINIVYEQFDVNNSKSGFLANRMVNFVYKDYDLLIKNHVDFTPFQEELFISHGMAAFDHMLQLYNGNPANIKTDLNMALTINRGNLDALEMLLKDNMVGTIAELKMVSDSGSSSSSSTFLNSMKNMFSAMRRERAANKKGALLASPVTYWFEHSDRYPVSSRADTTSTTPQSEFNDADEVRAQLCIQALAFNDQNSLIDLCSGTILKTPMKNVTDHDASYDEILKVHLNVKHPTEQMKRLNHSERVCAFREYNHKNMALYMGINNERAHH